MSIIISNGVYFLTDKLTCTFGHSYYPIDHKLTIYYLSDQSDYFWVGCLVRKKAF